MVDGGSCVLRTMCQRAALAKVIVVSKVWCFKLC